MPLVPRTAGRGRTAFEKWSAGVFLATLHVLPILAIWRGTVAADWWTAAGIHLLIALLVGTGLHRYFAHHAFRTSRAFQFILAVGTCLTFTDPIGFAGKHRIHHRYADTEDDVHSPFHGWWSCWFWSLADDNLSDADVLAATPDLVKYPELRLVHRFFFFPGLLLGASLWLIGGFSRMAIGYALALVLLLNFTSAVNYICHRYGSRRYETDEASRNNLLVAILTWGEGWHNNHHRYPVAARAGFAWYEIDVNYYLIRALAALGIVWGVREVPVRVLQEGGLT